MMSHVSGTRNALNSGSTSKASRFSIGRFSPSENSTIRTAAMVKANTDRRATPTAPTMARKAMTGPT